MSLFNWSRTGLPNPSNAYGLGVAPAVRRITMESGRSRQRKLFTTTDRAASVRWKLTDSQFALFQGVLEHKLNQGADWFLITLPTGDGLREVTARIQKGNWTAQQAPVLNWDVSANLDIQAASPLSSSEVDALLAD